ncbi:energy transducer TonB family protein [Bartonella sp. CB178]|uniref:energy transducer TonB family protein n=1 Tax=Bartonella sp. CB178 TaxID=3112255 RepID=UPI00300E10D2
MNFSNIRQLSILWVCAFIAAFSLHVGLGARFYFQKSGVSNGTLSQTIMLTFVQDEKTINLDANTDFLDSNADIPDVSTYTEVLHPDLEQESELPESVNEIQSEEVQNTTEKDDFITPVPEIKRKTTVEKIKRKSKAVTEKLDKKGAHLITAGNVVSPESALLAKWLAKVQAQLEKQKNYVVKRRISRAKGTVQLEFKISEQGDIFSSRVVRSSDDEELDRLAMTALQRVGSVPPPPPSKVNKIIRISLIFN